MSSERSEIIYKHSIVGDLGNNMDARANAWIDGMKAKGTPIKVISVYHSVIGGLKIVTTILYVLLDK